MRKDTLLSVMMIAACSKGDAEPASQSSPPRPKVIEPAAPKPPAATNSAPKPTAKPAQTARQLGQRVLADLSANKVSLDVSRRYVSITIDPASGRKSVTAFCGADNKAAWGKLAATLAASYGARLTNADPDTIRCDNNGALIFCEVTPQDEHEMELTFAIADTPSGPVIAGVAERNTFMVDPDSARYQADLAERDRELAKAATADCGKPGPSAREPSR